MRVQKLDLHGFKALNTRDDNDGEFMISSVNDSSDSSDQQIKPIWERMKVGKDDLNEYEISDMGRA